MRSSLSRPLWILEAVRVACGAGGERVPSSAARLIFSPENWVCETENLSLSAKLQVCCTITSGRFWMVCDHPWDDGGG